MPFMTPVRARKVPRASRSRLLRVTARLDIPLYFYVLPDEPDPDSTEARVLEICRDAGEIANSSLNWALYFLSTKTSRRSGSARHHIKSSAESRRPRILLVRADGEALTIQQVQTLYRFVIKEVKANTSLDSVSTAPLRCRLTPQRLRIFWNIFSTRECPATLSCKDCGRMPDGGEIFSTCRKCRVTRYCGTDCFRRHWRTHSRVCVKG